MSNPEIEESHLDDDYVSEAKESYGEFVLPEQYRDTENKESSVDDSLYSDHLQNNWGF